MSYYNIKCKFKEAQIGQKIYMNAMKKTLTRDEQIELMKTAEERHSALVKRVLADPLVREVVSEPAPTHFHTLEAVEGNL